MVKKSSVVDIFWSQIYIYENTYRSKCIINLQKNIYINFSIFINRIYASENGWHIATDITSIKLREKSKFRKI